MFKEWIERTGEIELKTRLGKIYALCPKANERPVWESAHKEKRDRFVLGAQQHKGYNFPSLPATAFMEFKRSGNREVYEKDYFAKRRALVNLVLGECFEYSGLYMDDIVNGIWSLCEESFWGVSAHNSADILYDTSNHIIDLFAAETAALLAYTHWILYDELNEVSTLITERIEREMKERIFKPLLERNDFWWLGTTGKNVNNWTPWITSNMLCVLFYMADDEIKYTALKKLMSALDKFIDMYHADGGCDEGTSYWSVAGGSLFDCLVHLKHIGADFSNEPLIKEIGRFIYRSHISGEYFINFADGGAKANPPGDLVYRYGKYINDPFLTQFGAAFCEYNNTDVYLLPLQREIPAILGHNELLREAGRGLPKIDDSFLDGIEVCAARGKRLYLAAKGGHNDESHNHNDVGSFIIYMDGKPAIIDVGVGVYTRQTFGPERYSIWTMQSAYHNLPTINGIMQAPGKEFCAKDISYTKAENMTFSLDISNAYPTQLGLDYWKRTFDFGRTVNESITITDSYKIKECKELFLTLMTQVKPEVKDGIVQLIIGGHALNIIPNYNIADIVVEEKIFDDKRLYSVWGNKLYRIKLIAKPINSAEIVTVFKLQE